MNRRAFLRLAEDTREHAADLRHKFTLADPCPVDGLLMPGEQTIGGVNLNVLPAPGRLVGRAIHNDE